MNIKLSYLYRCYGNYKNANEVVFSNPDNLTIEEVATIIQSYLIDGEWFYASKWDVSDMHFERYDDELDHPYHEFGSLEFTEELSNDERSITDFLRVVKSAGPHYIV